MPACGGKAHTAIRGLMSANDPKRTFRTLSGADFGTDGFREWFGGDAFVPGEA